MDQQLRMQEAFIGFANHISSSARDANAKWPIFRIPLFELHAGQVRLQSGVEFIGIQYMIEPKDEDEYLEYVTTNYKDSIAEGHMIRYGNMDRLKPIGYTPHFTVSGSTGLINDTIDRPIRSATWQVSPRKFFVCMLKSNL